jgi:hypothetical protein
LRLYISNAYMLKWESNKGIKMNPTQTPTQAPPQPTQTPPEPGPAPAPPAGPATPPAGDQPPTATAASGVGQKPAGGNKMTLWIGVAVVIVLLIVIYFLFVK